MIGLGTGGNGSNSFASFFDNAFGVTNGDNTRHQFVHTYRQSDGRLQLYYDGQPIGTTGTLTGTIANAGSYYRIGGEYTAGLVTYEIVRRVCDIDYDGESFEEILQIEYPNAFQISIYITLFSEDIDYEVPENVYYNSQSEEEDGSIEVKYVSKPKSNIAGLLPDILAIYEYYREDYKKYYKHKKLEDKVKSIMENY
jgi:hypothetical protein